MELIPYDQFAALRLRNFVPNPATVSEETGWEWMGSLWINEGIGFTSFSRHVTTPNETGGLEINFPELPPDAVQRLLSTIGLPLSPGMIDEEVIAALGKPTKTDHFVSDRQTHNFTIGSAQPYRVSCTVHEKNGLIFVTVVRPDLVSRKKRSA
jgi:hypothetical protein